MLPPPPGRFSTTTCWPHISLSFCGDQAAQHVDRAGRRERDDDADRPVGIVLRRARRRRQPSSMPAAIASAANDFSLIAPSPHLPCLCGLRISMAAAGGEINGPAMHRGAHPARCRRTPAVRYFSSNTFIGAMRNGRVVGGQEHRSSRTATARSSPPASARSACSTRTAPTTPTATPACTRAARPAKA